MPWLATLRRSVFPPGGSGRDAETEVGAAGRGRRRGGPGGRRNLGGRELHHGQGGVRGPATPRGVGGRPGEGGRQARVARRPRTEATRRVHPVRRRAVSGRGGGCDR